MVAAKVPAAQFIVAMASGDHRSELESAEMKSRRSGGVPPPNLLVVENETYDALHASDVAAVTSGTATLETGIIGTPMAIVYKTSATNWSLLEPLISAEHYGLINLIAGERIVKELIQNDFTAEALSAELLRLLEPVENSAARKKLKEAADKLGHGGASKRAAAAVLRTIDEINAARPARSKQV
jgi:lipid-A-disaccharide synthase